MNFKANVFIYLILSKKLKVKNKYEKNNDVAMTWMMRWLNRSITTINTTFQITSINTIYIYIDKKANK